MIEILCLEIKKNISIQDYRGEAETVSFRISTSLQITVELLSRDLEPRILCLK